MVKVFIVLGGVGDRPCKVLDEKTPLEAAKTKNLDYFSQESNFGYVLPISSQTAPTSYESLLAILGYDPKAYYLGGGSIEAFGNDVDYKNGWLALRTNFSSIKNGNIIDRCVGRSLTTNEALILSKEINEKVKLDVPFVFKSFFSHEGILVLKENLSANISNVDPACKKIGKYGVAFSNGTNRLQECRPLDPDRKTKLSAKLVNDFLKQSNSILEGHKINVLRKNEYLLPANIIIPRDASTALPALEKKDNWGAIVNANYAVGIAKLAGMNILMQDRATMNEPDVYDYLFKSIKNKIKISKNIVKENSAKAYFIHFNEIDICGHDNKPKEKKKMIELIDRKLFKFLKRMNDLELVVSGDHATPCETKNHTVDSVPLLHYKKNKYDSVQRFTERESLNGSYGKLLGRDVVNTIGFL